MDFVMANRGSSITDATEMTAVMPRVRRPGGRRGKFGQESECNNNVFFPAKLFSENPIFAHIPIFGAYVRSLHASMADSILVIAA
jgi:hypothetical protein